MKNRKGFIRIIEAFMMIIVITGVLLVFLSSRETNNYDNSIAVHDAEQNILQEIQKNSSLRDEILNQVVLPTDWENFPNSTKTKIISETPNDLNCEGKICSLNDNCILSSSVEKDVFVQRVLISSDLNQYSLRQLKLFCWKK